MKHGMDPTLDDVKLMLHRILRKTVSIIGKDDLELDNILSRSVPIPTVHNSFNVRCFALNRRDPVLGNF